MSISETFYNYINTNFTSTNGVFYLINDNEVKAPYAVISLIDDPQETLSLCATDQGQSRFQMDIYEIASKIKNGNDKREDLKAVVRGLIAQTISGYKFINVQAINSADRQGTEGNLIQYSFEALVEWEQ